MEINKYGIIIAGWTFEQEGETYSSHTFDALAEEEQKDLITKRLEYYEKVLNIFYETEIFFAKKISYTTSEKVRKFENLTSSKPSEVMKVLSKINEHTSGIGFSIKGTTKIEMEDKKRYEEDRVIGIGCGINLFNLRIHTYSDLWCPISYDYNLQLDIAVLNAPRLEKCLRKIKAIGNYSYIFPDEGQTSNEERMPQRGFRLCRFKHDLEDEIHYSNFPHARLDEFKPFII